MCANIKKFKTKTPESDKIIYRKRQISYRSRNNLPLKHVIIATSGSIGHARSGLRKD
ncbi:hypothetical protein JCM6292_2428 [Bacteroides pyogenes JCM 6292]|uniref:Uncharacterized protein n=1 Tax=Bacteroides pyogenes JCM 6292 TaxID=1235809 RepID=W4P8H4_9BACE|nr:hypothetical protein JCM6292_2428 [Bacteroides pyogenes JCM 6292]